jgi:hypothetical protein
MKTTNKTLIRFALLAAVSCSSNLLFAQPAEGQGGARKPPQEALDACKSLSAGQECGFTAPHGNINGVCWAPEGKPLVCKPKNAPNNDARPQGKK